VCLIGGYEVSMNTMSGYDEYYKVTTTTLQEFSVTLDHPSFVALRTCRCS
jgi:hypothetical protein